MVESSDSRTASTTLSLTLTLTLTLTHIRHLILSDSIRNVICHCASFGVWHHSSRTLVIGDVADVMELMGHHGYRNTG